jgi:sec-independent protein translocase protein TatC
MGVEDESQEDLAEGEMSLLEHLEELRKRLVRCAIAIGIFFIVGWLFSGQIYHFIEKPVLQALIEAQSLKLATVVHPTNVYSLQEGDSVQLTFPVESTLGGISVPAGVTIPGLVKKESEKLVVVTAQKWVVGNAVIPAGTELPVQIEDSGPHERLIIDTVTGAFSLYVRVALYAAIVFSMPFLLYQLWVFVAPGLYRHEKRYVLPFILMGTIFFVLGAAFGYYIAFPRAALWLLELGSGFRPLIKANDYFDLITIIMLGLGMVFQIPTITFFLARMGIVTPRMMARPWRYAIVVIFIVAAVISPTGDVANLMVFALPMLVLYALSIGIAWMVGKPRETSEA